MVQAEGAGEHSNMFQQATSSASLSSRQNLAELSTEYILPIINLICFEGCILRASTLVYGEDC